MERAARQAVLQQAEADFEPLPFDDRATRELGRVAASLRTSDRTVKARSDHANVAAFTGANELPLYTANADGFAGIDGLDVRAAPTPSGTER